MKPCIRTLLPTLALPVFLSMAACGGGGGSGNSGAGPDAPPSSTFPGCLATTWNVELTDLNGPACVDLGLEGVALEFEGAQGDIANPETLPYFIHSEGIEVEVPGGAPNTMLSAFYAEFDGGLIGLQSKVQFIGLAGYYYLPDEDVTVYLTTGPSLEEFAVTSVDCNSFLTFVDYEIYDGKPLVFTPMGGLVEVTLAPGAVELCNGRIQVEGSTGQGTAAEATSGETVLQGFLRIADRRLVVPLDGEQFGRGPGGLLTDAEGYALALEEQADGTVSVSAQPGLAGALRIEGLLTGGAGLLEGELLLQTPEGESLEGRLVVWGEQD